MGEETEEEVTGPLRGSDRSGKSDKSGMSGGKRVTKVTGLLRSSGKSDNRAATRQCQE